MSKSIILTSEQIKNTIRRIAFQIYESNANESEIIIAGIVDNGYVFAKRIATVLKDIAPIEITLCKVMVDKKNPLNQVKTDLNATDYTNKALVLVDDVLNSGSTLMYAVKHFLEVPLKRFKTAVLVNRNHKKYPIKADFKGVSLSTSLQEHITVDFKPKNSTAYLA